MCHQTHDSLCLRSWPSRSHSSHTVDSRALHSWDSDEEHKASAGEHVPPWLATVTYLGSHGAPTVVLPVAADAHGRAVGAGTDAFCSQPVAGKHLCFDGRLLHGALHELGAPSEDTYVRTSLLVNLWTAHQLGDGTTRLPAALAAQLSDEHALRLETARAVVPVEHPPGCLGLMSAHVPSGGGALADVGSGGGAAAAGDDSEGWRQLQVRFTPLRLLCEREPEWRTLGRLVGFPFVHPSIAVRRLPWHRAGPQPPSLLLVRSVGLRLPFEEGTAAGGNDGTESGTEPPGAASASRSDAYDEAADALVQAAVHELATSGEWQAARELRTQVAALRAKLPAEEAAEEEAAEAEAEAAEAEAARATKEIAGRGDAAEAAGAQAAAAAAVDAPEAEAMAPALLLAGPCDGAPRIRGEPALLYLCSAGLSACALCLINGLAPSVYARGHAAAYLRVAAADADGFTALHYAANLGLGSLLPPLVELGAPLQATTRDVSQLGEPVPKTYRT